MADKIKYQDGYKYQLVQIYATIIAIRPPARIESTYIVLDTDGTLSIRPGYAWDGPSGPTIDTKNFMRGSLVHDALYQLMRMELLPQSCRLLADEELHRACRDDGMSWIRAWYVKRALLRAGAPAASPSHKKTILEAP